MATREEIAREYGKGSPEHSARVYEDMLDARYERIAALEAEIENLGDNLEREKREIMIQRAARRRLAAWAAHDAERCKGAVCRSECQGLCGEESDEPPRILDDNGDWINDA